MRKTLTLFLLAGAIAGSAHLRPLYADDEAPQSYFADPAADGSGITLPCGQGTRVKCGEVSSYQCVRWIQTPTITLGVTGVGIGMTYFCEQSTTVTTYRFLDP